MSASLTIELLGETLEVLPSNTLHWPRRQTLLLADPHFGKAETFRHAAVPVPDILQQQLQRLDNVLMSMQAERLVILGDFWHARDGRTETVMATLSDWRDQYPKLEIEIVQGNHDRGSVPPTGWCNHWYESTSEDSPFIFAHFPEPSDDGYTLAGHLHPAVTLSGRGRQRLKLPCFWFGPQVGVLPAFGKFTGTANVRPRLDDRIFVSVDGEVIELSSSE